MKGLLCLLLGCIAAAGIANDGWIGDTGTPRIEGKHPSIRMVDEVILIKIGRTSMTADCRFTFRNEGKACTARIGFPDHDSDPYLDPKTGIRSIYDSFRCYVDGKRTATKLVDDGEDNGWQVKHVKFGKGQTRKIRNVYRIRLGILSLDGPGYKGAAPRIRCMKYILATGRSWKGTIGKSTVIVEFESSAPVSTPLRTGAWTGQKKSDDSTFWSKNKNLVLWGGPTLPRIQGRKLTFVRTNWEPTESDDVSLKFGLFYKNY